MDLEAFETEFGTLPLGPGWKYKVPRNHRFPDKYNRWSYLNHLGQLNGFRVTVVRGHENTKAKLGQVSLVRTTVQLNGKMAVSVVGPSRMWADAQAVAYLITSFRDHGFEYLNRDYKFLVESDLKTVSSSEGEVVVPLQEDLTSEPVEPLIPPPPEFRDGMLEDGVDNIRQCVANAVPGSSPKPKKPKRAEEDDFVPTERVMLSATDEREAELKKLVSAKYREFMKILRSRGSEPVDNTRVRRAALKAVRKAEKRVKAARSERAAECTRQVTEKALATAVKIRAAGNKKTPSDTAQKEAKEVKRRHVRTAEEEAERVKKTEVQDRNGRKKEETSGSKSTLKWIPDEEWKKLTAAERAKVWRSRGAPVPAGRPKESRKHKTVGSG